MYPKLWEKKIMDFLVMIIVLVGIPASQFTKNIFLADFYRRRVKK